MGSTLALGLKMESISSSSSSARRLFATFPRPPLMAGVLGRLLRPGAEVEARPAVEDAGLASKTKSSSSSSFSV